MYIFVKNLNDMKTENKKPKNPLAFPSNYETTYNGMTLRDYFAAEAMNGDPYEWVSVEELAKKSYAIADAMLKQREL